MNNVKEDKLLFEIPDYAYISGASSIIPICLGLFVFGILQTFEITNFKETFFTRDSLLLTSGASFLILIYIKIKTGLT